MLEYKRAPRGSIAAGIRELVAAGVVRELMVSRVKSR